jgi:hypothetical protein
VPSRIRLHHPNIQIQPSQPTSPTLAFGNHKTLAFSAPNDLWPSCTVANNTSTASSIGQRSCQVQDPRSNHSGTRHLRVRSEHQKVGTKRHAVRAVWHRRLRCPRNEALDPFFSPSSPRSFLLSCKDAWIGTKIRDDDINHSSRASTARTNQHCPLSGRRRSRLARS